MNSLACVMKAEITIPDFSSISKRSITLPQPIPTKAMEPSGLVIADSTGLKVNSKDTRQPNIHLWVTPFTEYYRVIHYRGQNLFNSGFVWLRIPDKK